MKKWGIGIEHEMRIRFKLVDSENKYRFIDSETLLYYYNIYEVIIMKKFKDYCITDAEKKYYEKIEKKIKIIELAKNKKPYLIDNDEEDINYYSMIYSLYNHPLLFFNYNFNNEHNMDFKANLNNLEKLYNGELEKKTYNYLKILFEKKSIDHFDIIPYPKTMIQKIFFYYGEPKITFEDFIKSINLHINSIRDIFDNDTVMFNNIGLDKFYKNLFILYSNKIPHIDDTAKTSSIEFKTIEYENINYQKALNDLIQLEKTFFYLVNHLPILQNVIKIYGELIYHNIGSVSNTLLIFNIIDLKYYEISEDYTGSYHIWITLPYKENDSYTTFINNHVHLANKLQLLEPILAAHYSSPSYNALENNQSKTSLRQFLNISSNYGTSDITLMYGKKKHVLSESNNLSYYYLSEEDILNKNRFYLPYNNYQAPIYDLNGNNIINYSGLFTRRITDNIFKPIDEGDIESNNNINIQNYFTMIFEKTKIRYKNLHYPYLLGADIRTRNLNDFIYPLSDDWEKCFLMKKNKLLEVYYNENLKKISYERIYNEDDYKNSMENRIGIEFRILDHFPTNYLSQIMSLLVPIALDSIKTDKKILFKNTYIAKQFWHNEMFNVITKGYKYTAGIQYLNKLEKEFNINFSTKKNMDTTTILEELFMKMSKRHKGPLYNKMKFQSKINFINFNKKAWYEVINHFFKERPKLFEKIMYLNKNLSNNEIINIIGEKNNYNLTKIKNYLENIN